MSDVPIDVNETLARIVTIGIEALETSGVAASGVPQFLHAQSAFPYFIARVTEHTLTVDENEPEGLLQHEIIIALRLVIGHLTEGYSGQTEDALYSYIPAVITHFAERMWLRCAEYPESLPNLVRAEIIANNGLRIFEHASIQAQQVGTEFTILCKFVQQIDQAFS